MVSTHGFAHVVDVEPEAGITFDANPGSKTLQGNLIIEKVQAPWDQETEPVKIENDGLAISKCNCPICAMFSFFTALRCW